MFGSNNLTATTTLINDSSSTTVSIPSMTSLYDFLKPEKGDLYDNIYNLSESLLINILFYVVDTRVETLTINDINYTVHSHERSLIIQLLSKKIDINTPDQHGLTVLMVCCTLQKTREEFNLLKTLVECGGDVSLQDSYGRNALMLFCRVSRKTTLRGEIIHFLVHHNKGNINEETLNGQSALSLASAFTKTTSTEDTVSLLIELGANQFHQALYNAIDYAGIDSTENTVKILITSGKINPTDILPYCLNSILLYKSHFGVADILLELGADVDHPTEEGMTLLMELITVTRTQRYGNQPIRILEYLVKNKADVNIKNKLDITAFMMACLISHIYYIPYIARILMIGGLVIDKTMENTKFAFNLLLDNVDKSNYPQELIQEAFDIFDEPYRSKEEIRGILGEEKEIINDEKGLNVTTWIETQPDVDD